MQVKTGRWLMAALVGLGMYFSLLLPVDAATIKEYVAYRIIDVNSGKVLDIADASDENGAVVQIHDKEEGKKNQMFFIEKEDKSVVIRAVHSNSVVMVKKSSFSNSAPVVQWADEDLTSMRWKVIHNDDGSVSFENRNSGMMLDVTGGKKSNGTPLQQYRADGTDSQKFRLEEVSFAELSNMEDDDSNLFRPEKEKVYRIVNIESGKVLDVVNKSKDNGAPLQLLEKKTGNKNQMFAFTRQGYGCYSMLAWHTDKAIEIEGDSKELGARLIQWPPADKTANQMWRLIRVSGDAVVIYNRNSELVVDVLDGELVDGQPITQYKYNGSAAQIFRLEEVHKSEYK